jgi:hypothetical protein
MKPGHRVSGSDVQPSGGRERARPRGSGLGGFALPVALIAIMVIGAIVTGGFYVSSRGGGERLDEALGERAFYVAELGLEEALDDWRNGTLARVDSVFVSSEEEVVQGEHPLGSYAIDIQSLGGALYLISSTGRVSASGRTVVRRIASVVRIVEPALPAPAALTVYGGLTVGDGSRIDGAGAPREDCGAGAEIAGVAVQADSLVSPSTSGRITGTPPVAVDPTLDTRALSRFGDVPLEVLIGGATRVYEDGESESGMGPVTSVDSTGAEVCDTSIRGNWGDPSGASSCGDEFPVILAVGDLHVARGTGQGILIVEGDLTMAGDFAFYGVVIVKGRLQTAGTRNRVDGGVVVHGGGGLQSGSATLAGSVIRYAPCRIDHAFAAVLHRPVVPVSRTGRTAAGLGNR